MRRRDFIASIGGAAIGWPLAAHAQQPKLPTIGFLGPLTSSAMSRWTAAFVQRLRELGWIEGRTIVIEYRWGEGRSERFPEIVAEFVRLKVSVIVTGGTAAVIAAKQATSVIPIIFGSVADPVGTGLVASLARPGGNVTGLSNQSPDLPGKLWAHFHPNAIWIVTVWCKIIATIRALRIVSGPLSTIHDRKPRTHCAGHSLNGRH